MEVFKRVHPQFFISELEGVGSNPKDESWLKEIEQSI